MVGRVRHHTLVAILKDAVLKYQRAHEEIINMFKGHEATYIVGSLKRSSEDLPRTVVIGGSKLDFKTDISDINLVLDNATVAGERPLCCSLFCSGSKNHLPGVDTENAGTISVTPFLNKSVKSQQSAAPVAEYCPVHCCASTMLLGPLRAPYSYRPLSWVKVELIASVRGMILGES